jgi:hypothetical protein
MKNEYTANEIMEIGEANELILGGKSIGIEDLDQTFPGSLDLDE